MKLDDVEWSNNVVFLIHNSPRAILRCHDNFWCGLAEIQLANYENAEMRLEQVAKEDPNYLGALFLQQQLCRTEPSERNQTRYKELDGEIKSLRNGASSIELEFAAIAQYAIGKPGKAAEYLDKSQKRHGIDQRTLALRCAVESKADKMDSLLEQIPEDTNCALGQYYLAEKLLRARQHTRAQTLTENMLQANSSCSLAHVQMVKAAFGVQDWDVVNSSSSWLISVIPQFWDGYMYLALESLLTTGSETAAADRLESMLSNAGETFPKAISFARLLVRTVGQSKVLSPQIEKMLAKCADSADAKTVRGDYYLLKGNVRKAKECYNEALSMDSGNPGAFVGVVWCWLRLGDRRRAKQQLDMAGAIPEDKRKQLPELHLLEVELGIVANKFDALKTATVEITKNLAGRAYDLSLLEELNPNLCLEILKCYMKLIDKEEVRTAAKLPNHVKRAERLLTVVKNAVGGLTPVKVVDAEFKCMIGKFEDAEEVLRRMVPGSDVYLLQAKVANERADPDSARRLLDSALAADYNFGEHCPYQLVAAETAMLKNNFGEAIKLLNKALASGNLTENESVAANLKLSEAFRRNGQANESSNVMEKIEKDFSSASAVAAKLALSKAEQLLDAGNVEAAIDTLENVAYDTAGAFQAKARLAEIYLVQRRNEERYLTVFRDICHNRPGEFEPLVAFADSLMRVNRIDDAVRTYEAALRLKKTDTALQVKIGQAMAITHDYSGAISYYRKSLVSSECGGLRLELADLFVRLGQIEDAIATLEEAYDDPTIDKMLQARCYYKHADILAEDYKTDEALQKLAKAKNLLDEAIKNNVEGARDLSIEIHLKIGDLARERDDADNAVKFYSRAKTISPGSASANQATLKLADAYRLKGDLTSAQAVLSKLLDSDVASQAQSMIADVICDTGNIQGAIQHFKRLFEGGRDQWGILGRMMPLLHRNRQLDLAQQYMKQIKENSSPAAKAYCFGMLDGYQLRTKSAIDHLLQAKRSPRWRTQAIHAIIDIALGLESEELNMDEGAVYICKRLLYELPQNDLETKLYENWVLLANNDLNDGIKGFQALDRKCHVASLTGSCAGLIMQGNGKIAKNQLVSVLSTPYTMKVAKHLEKARLLLGQELINSGKPAKAREELEKILEKNRGCWRAMELRGITFEMEKNYEEAMKSFEYGWKMCSRNNPAIGFRLAQIYPKVDQPIKSIPICHYIKKNFPDYPQIDEILDAALYQVRH